MDTPMSKSIQLGVASWHYTVYPALALGFVYSMSSPIQAEQVVRLLCDEAHGKLTPDKVCRQHEGGNASTFLKWTNVVSAIALLVVGGTYGALADVKGRRLPWALMFASNAVSLLPNLMVEYAPFASYWRQTIYVGNVVANLLGGYSAGLLCQFSYVADCLRPEDRGIVFALIEGLMATGGVAGNIVGGALVASLGFRAPYAIAILVSLASSLYVALIPESLPLASRHATLDWSRANTVASLRTLLSLRSPESSGRWFIICCALCFAGGFLVLVTISTVTTLFVQQVFDWGPATVGLLFGAQGILRFVVFFFILPRYRHSIHTTYNEMRLSVVSLFVSAVLIGALAIQSPILFFVLFTVMGTPAFMPFGFLRSQFSKSVGAGDQGLILSAIASLEIVTSIVASLVVGTTFSVTDKWFPGLIFLVFAGVFVAGGLLLLATPWDNKAAAEAVPLLRPAPTGFMGSRRGGSREEEGEEGVAGPGLAGGATGPLGPDVLSEAEGARAKARSRSRDWDKRRPARSVNSHAEEEG